MTNVADRHFNDKVCTGISRLELRRRTPMIDIKCHCGVDQLCSRRLLNVQSLKQIVPLRSPKVAAKFSASKPKNGCKINPPWSGAGAMSYMLL
eukprot:5159851-Pleurochrysis_carterae.AAC.3